MSARKFLTPEQKISIIRAHLIEKVPVSELCDKHGISVVNWTRSYGKAYEHNGWIPRDHWLDESEKQGIIQYHFDHPLEGYRLLTYWAPTVGWSARCQRGGL